MEKTREQRIADYVAAEKKSVAGALLLAVLFGPLGHLYASAVGGSIAILIALVFAVTNTPLVVLVWLVCIVTAPVAAHDANRKLRAKAELIAGS